LKKYIILLAVFLLVVMVSGCTSDQNIPTKNFTGSGMSFLYPDTWNVTTKVNANATLIMVQNEEFQSSEGAKGSVVLIMKVYNASASNMTDTSKEFAKLARSGKNFTNNTINIASANASDMSYIGNDTQGNNSYTRLINFTKNNTLYLLMFATGGGSDIEASKPFFDVIIKSFKLT